MHKAQAPQETWYTNRRICAHRTCTRQFSTNQSVSRAYIACYPVASTQATATSHFVDMVPIVPLLTVLTAVTPTVRDFTVLLSLPLTLLCVPIDYPSFPYTPRSSPSQAHKSRCFCLQLGGDGMLYVRTNHSEHSPADCPLSNSDDSPNGRTLASASFTNTTSMTTESCIDFCDAQGFVYAGTEWSQECCMRPLFCPTQGII